LQRHTEALMTTRIGFVGLGLMGNPMSRNLIRAGHEVTVWNRTASRMVDLVEAGAIAAASPMQVAAASEVTITMVSDSPDVEDVVLGDGGVLHGAAPGSVVSDMSTISPSVTRMLAGRLSERGVQMMDAPVSGSVNGAEAGTLSIMVGGARSTFDRCLPIFELLGKTVTYCGESGMGQVTKLANQVAGLGTLAAMCEGLVFAARQGADLEAVLSAFSAGAADSWMVRNLGQAVVQGRFEPGFMVKLAHKDMGLLLDTATEAGLPLITTPLVAQMLRSCQQAGFGDEGIQAYVKVLERLAGVEART